MNARIGLGLAFALAAAACAPTAGPPAPTATAPVATPAPELVGVWFAREKLEPVRVVVPVPFQETLAAGRVAQRMAALRTAPLAGPYGSFNVVPSANALLRSVTIKGALATLDYEVGDAGWGLEAPGEVGAFAQQVVWTVTEEPGIEEVWFSENGTGVAWIEGVSFTRPQSRATVVPPLPEPMVYFARDLALPVGVILEGIAKGDTPAERIRSRMTALERESAPQVPDAYNVLARMRARLTTVTVEGSLVVLDYAVPDDDWGLDGSATLRAFVEQVVFTATDEPGMRSVQVTQNGGRIAIVGGEGLVIDRPITRAELFVSP